MPRPGRTHATSNQLNSASPRLAPPDPKGPSFTSSPRNPRRFTYCAAISGFSALNPGRNPTKRSTHNCASRRPLTLTDIRPHSPAPAGASKVVCCDIWIFGRVWDPICEISQHSTCQTTEIPNHRSVTWFTNQFNAPQPRDVCCDIACFGPRFTSWWEISQHTSLEPPASRRAWVSTVLRYLDFGPRIWALIPQNAAHCSRRKGWTWGRAALNREGVDKQCETGLAHTGTQLHF